MAPKTVSASLMEDDIKEIIESFSDTKPANNEEADIESNGTLRRYKYATKGKKWSYIGTFDVDTGKEIFDLAEEDSDANSDKEAEPAPVKEKKKATKGKGKKMPVEDELKPEKPSEPEPEPVKTDEDDEEKAAPAPKPKKEAAKRKPKAAAKNEKIPSFDDILEALEDMKIDEAKEMIKLKKDGEKQVAAPKKSRKKAANEEGKEKKEKGPYHQFLSDQLKELAADTSVAPNDRMKIVMAKWKEQKEEIMKAYASAKAAKEEIEA